jgi:ribonucleoside-diphosphate reductase alpha chain
MGAPLTDNAMTVLQRRYLARAGTGAVPDDAHAETPAQLWDRVGRHIAAADARYGLSPAQVAATAATFTARMAALEFLPNSPTLMNAGRPLGQLAACFVVPVEDSTQGIFDAVGWAAQIQKTGGGTGFSFSRLRPAGDMVASTGGISSGPVAFMQVFDIATEAIKQGGTRRGANMGMLRVDHPDILEFIAVKLDPERMRNFNLSVAITDAFMAAAAAGKPYDLVSPRTGAVVRSLDARHVLDAIVGAAWAVGDPGLVFIDRINDEQPTPDLGPIEATNPCVTGDTRIWVEDRGLVPIRDLVGTTPSIATFADGRVVFRQATQVICTGVRPVYRLTTIDGHSLRLTAEHLVMTDRGDRPAEALRPGDKLQPVEGSAWTTVASLGYDRDEEVFDLTEPTTSHFFADGLLVHNCGEQPLLPFESCTLGSINLAKFVRGGAIERERLRDAIHDAVHFLDNVIDQNRYPLPAIEAATRATRKIGLGVMGWADLLVELDIAYDSDAALALAGEVAEMLERESLAASERLAEQRGAFPAWLGSRWARAGKKLRNATTTTVAPTGTISIIAGCSSGIEPLYAIAYQRHVLDGAVLTEINPAFRRSAEAAGAWTEPVAAAVGRTGRARDIAGVPADLARRFPTAHDVDIEWHVQMQAAWQRHVHAAVSKTINLRRDATPADVRTAYELAFKLGCKGITVYRDGSREGQVLTSGEESVERKEQRDRCPECGGALFVHARCSLCRACGWSVCG